MLRAPQQRLGQEASTRLEKAAEKIMGQIQTSIGLITGFPIQDTVEQLLVVSGQPRNLAFQRNAALKTEQVAVNQLSSLLLSFQFSVNQLGKTDVFEQTSVTSSDPSTLNATLVADASPTAGSYQFTPLQTAQAQQYLSSEFESTSEPIGSGTLSFQSGGFVDSSISLSELNDGTGVQRGKIRVTDRSGATAIVDLRAARTVDDVLEAISTNTEVNIRAVADGDSIRLVDLTGESGNLSVQEVAGGSTAEDLGLAGISVAQDEATGQDVLRLHNNSKLTTLNDGNGVGFLEELADIEVSLADGTTLEIDFLAGEDAETTLGAVLNTINAVDPARLTAQISADGARIELTDLTSGGGTFAASSLFGGTAAEDLGLTETASAGVITGQRLQAGLKTRLLSSFNGGTGLGTLGTIEITDRNGTADLSVDLSSAETLEDIVEAINASSADVEASINDARNGIQIKDTSGGSGNLIIANGDGTNSADALNITLDEAESSVNSSSLGLQIVSRQTKLDDLNRGQGVAIGSFIITDSAGTQGAVQLGANDGLKTVGEVIDAINALSIAVTARINDTGDGIVLEDTAGGSDTLKVRDSGKGTSASDLGLLRTAVDVNGTPTIDGTARHEITIDAEDTLEDLIESINALDSGLTASSFFTGTGYRLTLNADATGTDGEFLIDTTEASFTVEEISQSRDALLLLGSSGNSAAGLLVQSSSNTFSNVVDGVDLTISQASDTPVTVNISASETKIIDSLNGFVKSYNSLRTSLNSLTSFDELSGTTGVLFGSREALRVESDLTNLLTRRFSGVGEFRSLEGIGIEISDTGELSLDQTKLREAFASDPASLKELFTNEEFGVADKLSSAIDRLAGKEFSLLSTRNDALASKIESTDERIEFLGARIDAERERLLAQFYQMELVIGRMQNDLAALNSLQIFAPLTSTSSS